MGDDTGGLQQALRVLRAERNMTQKSLAAAAGLSAAYISQIESGTKQPSMASLERLAAALRVSTSHLLARAEAAQDDPQQAAGQGAVSAAMTVDPAIRSRGGGRTVIPHVPTSGHRGRARDLAAAVLRDPAAAASLVTQARRKEQDAEAWRLGDVRNDLRTLIALLGAFADGSYRAVPWESLVLVVAGLQYYVNPEDVVPDYLEEGYLDDAAVLAFVAEMVAPDLDAFAR